MQMLKAVIAPLIEEALNEVGVVNEHWKNMLTPSRELEQGDISLPCFPFAKQLGKAPPVIAELIAFSYVLRGQFPPGWQDFQGKLNVKA